MTSTIVTITDADIEHRVAEIYLHLELDVDGAEDFHSICLESRKFSLQENGTKECRQLIEATGHRNLEDVEDLIGSIVRVERHEDGSAKWSASSEPGLAKAFFERKCRLAHADAMKEAA